MRANDLIRDTERLLAAAAGRTSKPRKRGITMVLTLDIVNFGPEFMKPFASLVDKVKILDTLWHDDHNALANAVRGFHELDISVALGGTQFELAIAHKSIDQYVEMLTDLGVTEVEVEHHADDASLAQMQEEVAAFKEAGFSVVGEVGKKWWWKDPTRTGRDSINVDRTIQNIDAYVAAGADLVYWEGAVVGGLIGRQLENMEGQQQLQAVAAGVDSERLVFEIYDRRGQPLWPMVSWLIMTFGPNVNVANIDPWSVKRLEWNRNGIIFEMDHPYMRWRANPSLSEHWWDLPDRPDYSVDVQRPYLFGDEHRQI